MNSRRRILSPHADLLSLSRSGLHWNRLAGLSSAGLEAPRQGARRKVVERPRPATGNGRGGGGARNRMLARLPMPALVSNQFRASVLSRGPCPLPAEGDIRALKR
jgi:hypothetical protein